MGLYVTNLKYLKPLIVKTKDKGVKMNKKREALLMARDIKGKEKCLVNTDIYALSLVFYLKLYWIFKSQYAKKIPDHSWVIPVKSKKLV